MMNRASRFDLPMIFRVIGSVPGRERTFSGSSAHHPIRQFHALLTREHVPDLRPRMLMLQRQRIDLRTQIRLGDNHFVAGCRGNRHRSYLRHELSALRSLAFPCKGQEPDLSDGFHHNACRSGDRGWRNPNSQAAYPESENRRTERRCVHASTVRESSAFGSSAPPPLTSSGGARYMQVG